MSIGGLSLRTGNPEDLDELWEIEKVCYGSVNALSRISLRQYMDLSGPGFALAETPSQVVGFAIGAVALGGDDHTGWLLDVAILPGFQGRGVGSMVCRHVLDRLTRFGVRVVRATVSPDNERSFRMLKSLGFVVVEEVLDYFGPGKRRIVVELRS